ncbi:MAG: 50S ribosomal protein L20 [Sedimentisphaerales bacterium]|nr:50S ribosomal protein L20 [Sedimentisphaerales bacterium]
MPRVSKGAARRQSKKRIFKAVRGFRGPRSKNWRLAQESLVRAQATATKDRKRKKRDFRSLWIVRISAACRSRDIRYSQFINGLKLAQISINRKMLSEMAIHDPEGFDQVVETARKALESVA